MRPTDHGSRGPDPPVSTSRRTDLSLRSPDSVEKNVILGFTWLKEHNPEIDWETKEVKLSRCPRRCTECRDEICAEKAPTKVTREYPNYLRESLSVTRCLSYRSETCSGSPSLTSPSPSAMTPETPPKRKLRTSSSRGRQERMFRSWTKETESLCNGLSPPTRGRSPRDKHCVAADCGRACPEQRGKGEKHFMNSFRPCSGISRMSLQRSPSTPFRTTGNGTMR